MILGNYDGGKGRLYQKLINLMPPHSVYVEAFLGGGSVMLHKRPSKINIGIDLSVAVVAEWRKHIAENDDASASPEMASAAVIADSGDVSWQIICGDALAWLQTAVLLSDALVYCDPPYLANGRSQKRPLYKHEMMTEREHERFLDVALGLDCMVMISGYYSELYAEKLFGWETAVYPSYTRTHRKVDEYVWMNYPLPDQLHDYSFLGDDFRERERIKRKKTRWVKKLQKMRRLERLAIMAAIERRLG